jgi:uncharacterized protein
VVLAMWDILLELAPWLLLGTAIAALLHGLVPAGLIRRQLRGPSGVFKAVAFGVPLPLCSCGVIPAGLGLKRSGASNGAAVGFLIATPQTGVDSIAVSGAFLGWPFAIFKVVAALVTGLVGGLLTEAAGDTPGDASEDGAPDDEVRESMLEHGLQVLRTIWKWLVFGVVASAAITHWVPQDWLTSFAGASPLVTMGAALLIGIPLYVCATASVPIAAALVAGGLPPGAALVFLMAGPATNVATIGAVLKGFGRRALAIYLSTIIVGSVGFGLLFDGLIRTDRVAHHHHGSDAWWAIACAGLLLALFLYFAIDETRITMNAHDANTQDNALTVTVGGMSCGGCSSRLTRVLEALDGVDQVAVVLEPGSATVAGSIDRAGLIAAIEGAGFDAE